jgi:glycosyltransferase involved in cell wall biosynthesis
MGGCEAYRMTIPADYLQTQGKVVDYAHWSTVQKQANLATRSGAPGPGAYDIYVFPRSGPAIEGTTELLRRAGKKLVLEVDDDFTGRHRNVISVQEHYDVIWRFARQYTDAITVSTAYLVELMRRETNKPVYVLPNSVHLGTWVYSKKRPQFTIGLTGSITHAADWIVLQDVIPTILERYTEVHFLLGGFRPDYWEQLVTHPRVEFQPWVEYRDYPRIAGSAHIVLCPVDPTDSFNLSKSGLKAIEGMASKAAVIATDMQIYRDVMVNMRHGLLVPHTPEAWYAAIESLIIDRQLRSQYAGAGQQHVRRHFSIDRNAILWWQAYRSIAQL